MYPQETRRIARLIYDQLHSLRKTAKLLQLCHTSISRWFSNPTKLPRKKTKESKTDRIIGFIKGLVKSDPFIELRKMKQLVKETLKIDVSTELIRVALKKSRLSRKFARFHDAPITLEKKVLEFLEKRKQYIDENRKFLSLDEVSFGRKQVKRKGYASKGTKLYIRDKPRYIKTKSACVMVSNKGIVGKNIIDKAFNKQSFLDFLKTIEITPGDVVLLDNVKFHHSKEIKDYCHSKGIILLYVPPYSPWFNPIELCFSVIKQQFYKQRDIDASFNALKENHFVSFFNKSLGCNGPY